MVNKLAQKAQIDESFAFEYDGRLLDLGYSGDSAEVLDVLYGIQQPPDLSGLAFAAAFFSEGVDFILSAGEFKQALEEGDYATAIDTGLLGLLPFVPEAISKLGRGARRLLDNSTTIINRLDDIPANPLNELAAGANRAEVGASANRLDELPTSVNRVNENINIDDPYWLQRLVNSFKKEKKFWWTQQQAGHPKIPSEIAKLMDKVRFTEKVVDRVRLNGERMTSAYESLVNRGFMTQNTGIRGIFQDYSTTDIDHFFDRKSVIRLEFNPISNDEVALLTQRYNSEFRLFYSNKEGYFLVKGTRNSLNIPAEMTKPGWTQLYHTHPRGANHRASQYGHTIRPNAKDLYSGDYYVAASQRIDNYPQIAQDQYTILATNRFGYTITRYEIAEFAPEGGLTRR